MDKRLARGRRYFEYHCYEGEDSGDAIVWHHTHQKVEVLRRVNLNHIEFKVYRVRFADGLEYDVFGDELMKSPADYYRPDYKQVTIL